VAKTCFFWDELEDNIVEEFDDADVTVADYTTEPDHFGNVISQHRSGQSSFFHYDALGSTLSVTDEGQQVTDTRAYSAFGEATEASGNTLFPYQYLGAMGYYTDAVTGKLLARDSVYDPQTTRWLTSAFHPLLYRTPPFVETHSSEFNLTIGAINVQSLFVHEFKPLKAPPTPPGICASTGCDELRGVVTNFNVTDPAPRCSEKCMSEIVRVHESTHVKNIGNCCTLRNKCLAIAQLISDREIAQRWRTECERAWRFWSNLNLISLEQRASYASCAKVRELERGCTRTVLRFTGRPAPAPTACMTRERHMQHEVKTERIDVASDCCDNVRRELDNPCKHADPNATLLCCPYKEDGELDAECIRLLRNRYIEENPQQ
jgi:hypothetical protein